MESTKGWGDHSSSCSSKGTLPPHNPLPIAHCFALCADVSTLLAVLPPKTRMLRFDPLSSGGQTLSEPELGEPVRANAPQRSMTSFMTMVWERERRADEVPKTV